MESVSEKVLIGKKIAEVISVRLLTESTYVLRLSRNGLQFKPGQYIVLGPIGSKQKREYSIYSPVNSPYLEVLIKEVDEGYVSKKFKKSKPGDLIEVEGPFGYFVLDEKKIPERKYLFIASGTGISPFHSIILSYPHLNYTLLHGVRIGEEGYEHHVYEQERCVQCTSRDKNGKFHGRVTDYLRKHIVDPGTIIYLCGNSAMIDEAYTILEQQGLPSSHLHAEIYF